MSRPRPRRGAGPGRRRRGARRWRRPRRAPRRRPHPAARPSGRARRRGRGGRRSAPAARRTARGRIKCLGGRSCSVGPLLAGQRAVGDLADQLVAEGVADPPRRRCAPGPGRAAGATRAGRWGPRRAGPPAGPARRCARAQRRCWSVALLLGGSWSMRAATAACTVSGSVSRTASAPASRIGAETSSVKKGLPPAAFAIRPAIGAPVVGEEQLGEARCGVAIERQQLDLGVVARGATELRAGARRARAGWCRGPGSARP